jgi:hypothetical protein
MVWVLRNGRSGGYWHPDNLQGVTLNHPERAYRFSDRAEAEAVAAELNERDRQPEYGQPARRRRLPDRRQLGVSPAGWLYFCRELFRAVALRDVVLRDGDLGFGGLGRFGGGFGGGFSAIWVRLQSR